MNVPNSYLSIQISHQKIQSSGKWVHLTSTGGTMNGKYYQSDLWEIVSKCRGMAFSNEILKCSFIIHKFINYLINCVF